MASAQHGVGEAGRPPLDDTASAGRSAAAVASAVAEPQSPSPDAPTATNERVELSPAPHHLRQDSEGSLGAATLSESTLGHAPGQQSESDLGATSLTEMSAPVSQYLGAPSMDSGLLQLAPGDAAEPTGGFSDDEGDTQSKSHVRGGELTADEEGVAGVGVEASPGSSGAVGGEASTEGKRAESAGAGRGGAETGTTQPASDDTGDASDDELDLSAFGVTKTARRVPLALDEYMPGRPKSPFKERVVVSPSPAEYTPSVPHVSHAHAIPRGPRTNLASREGVPGPGQYAYDDGFVAKQATSKTRSAAGAVLHGDSDRFWESANLYAGQVGGERPPSSVTPGPGSHGFAGLDFGADARAFSFAAYKEHEKRGDARAHDPPGPKYDLPGSMGKQPSKPTLPFAGQGFGERSDMELMHLGEGFAPLIDRAPTPGYKYSQHADFRKPGSQGPAFTFGGRSTKRKLPKAHDKAAKAEENRRKRIMASIARKKTQRLRKGGERDYSWLRPERQRAEAAVTAGKYKPELDGCDLPAANSTFKNRGHFSFGHGATRFTEAVFAPHNPRLGVISTPSPGPVYRTPSTLNKRHMHSFALEIRCPPTPAERASRTVPGPGTYAMGLAQLDEDIELETAIRTVKSRPSTAAGTPNAVTPTGRAAHAGLAGGRAEQPARPHTSAGATSTTSAGPNPFAAAASPTSAAKLTPSSPIPQDRPTTSGTATSGWARTGDADLSGLGTQYVDDDDGLGPPSDESKAAAAKRELQEAKAELERRRRALIGARLDPPRLHPAHERAAVPRRPGTPLVLSVDKETARKVARAAIEARPTSRDYRFGPEPKYAFSGNATLGSGSREASMLMYGGNTEFSALNRGRETPGPGTPHMEPGKDAPSFSIRPRFEDPVFARLEREMRERDALNKAREDKRARERKLVAATALQHSGALPPDFDYLDLDAPIGGAVRAGGDSEQRGSPADATSGGKTAAKADAMAMATRLAETTEANAVTPRAKRPPRVLPNDAGGLFTKHASGKYQSAPSAVFNLEPQKKNTDKLYFPGHGRMGLVSPGPVIGQVSSLTNPSLRLDAGRRFAKAPRRMNEVPKHAAEVPGPGQYGFTSPFSKEDKAAAMAHTIPAASLWPPPGWDKDPDEGKNNNPNQLRFGPM